MMRTVKMPSGRYVEHGGRLYYVNRHGVAFLTRPTADGRAREPDPCSFLKVPGALCRELAELAGIPQT